MTALTMALIITTCYYHSLPLAIITATAAAITAEKIIREGKTK